jgi:xanthine dehydrogenase accessory factor
LLARIAEIEASGSSAAVVTIVRTSGSTPREMGARMLVHPDGAIEGTIGGGKIEQEAIAEATAAIGEGRPRHLEFKLTQELGMCCGGQVALFIEPVIPSPRLIIFGAGHVGAALSRLATHAGFVVHVADEREELLDPKRLAEARQLHDALDDPALPFSAGAFVMVTTHDHALDQALVEKALKKPSRWLGLIGSRRKAELTKERLVHKGFSADEVARVRCPVGLAIRAETPEEIAIAILSEMIAVRRGATIPSQRSEDGLDAELETKARR